MLGSLMQFEMDYTNCQPIVDITSSL